MKCSENHKMVCWHLQKGHLLRKKWFLCCIRRCYSSLGESPELPDWVKSSDKSSDPEEDFVLPAKLDGLGNNGSFVHGGAVFCRLLPPQPTKNSDAEAISRILRGPFSSPDAAVRALDGCDVNISKELVDKVMKRFRNDWISAFGFFNWADSRAGYLHSQDSYNAMVDILGKAKQFESMWSLIDEMVQVRQLVSLTTMSKVMRRLAGARRWGEAVETFNNIEHFGLKKDTSAMNVILDTLCKENAVRRARDLFLDVRDIIPPDASSFNALIHGWCKARRFDEARWTMEEMKRFGFEPCVISYTSLVEAHSLDRNFHEIDLILNEMEANGCPPNVVTYTIIMHAHGKAKEIHQALQVYDKMKDKGCVPDTMFYNSLLYIIARAGRVQDAYDLYDEMKKNHISPNITTFNTLITAACSHLQEEKALKFLGEMEENSCEPDLTTFAPLLKMKCESRTMKVLMFLLDYMFNKDISLDLGTYSLLVNRLCKHGCLVQACLFFEEMVIKGFLPRNSTYSMLMVQLDQNNMERSKEKIRKLMAKAHSMGGGSYQVPNKFRNSSSEI